MTWKDCFKFAKRAVEIYNIIMIVSCTWIRIRITALVYAVQRCRDKTMILMVCTVQYSQHTQLLVIFVVVTMCLLYRPLFLSLFRSILFSLISLHYDSVPTISFSCSFSFHFHFLPSLIHKWCNELKSVWASGCNLRWHYISLCKLILNPIMRTNYMPSPTAPPPLLPSSYHHA